MPARQLIQYLTDKQVRFQVLEHPQAFTAQEVAQSAHIRGRQLAKSVILNIDHALAMLVLPASYRINLDNLKQSIRAFHIRLATEQEFNNLFPSCEPGALPPFGNLYGMDLYMADCMAEDRLLTFCAGSHSELMQIATDDYLRLTNPVLVSFGAEPIGATPPRMREHSGVYP